MRTTRIRKKFLWKNVRSFKYGPGMIVGVAKWLPSAPYLFISDSIKRLDNIDFVNSYGYVGLTGDVFKYNSFHWLKSSEFKTLYTPENQKYSQLAGDKFFKNTSNSSVLSSVDNTPCRSTATDMRWKNPDDYYPHTKILTMEELKEANPKYYKKEKQRGKEMTVEEQIRMKAEIVNRRIAYLYNKTQLMANDITTLDKDNHYYRAMVIDNMMEYHREADISRKIMEELGLYNDLREDE